MSIQPATAPASQASSAPERVAGRRTYLMCRPDHFTVSYSINPWMHPEDPTNTALAVRQWQALHDTYVELGHRVELIDQLPGTPDMVYTANGGFTLDGIAFGAEFAHAERRAEGPAFLEWFQENGFRTVAATAVNEGEGDLLLVGDTILAGRGFRSSPDAAAEVAGVFDREVLGLTLVNPRFYHLDTALAVLDPAAAEGEANIAYLPSAFDEAGRALLERRYPDAIRLEDADAEYLGLNSISDGRRVVVAERATRFQELLRERGYEPVTVDLSELLLGGGGVKCATLELRR